MVVSKEDYENAFGKSNFAVLKGEIVLKKGTALASGGVLIDDEYIFEKSKDRMSWLDANQHIKDVEVLAERLNEID